MKPITVMTIFGTRPEAIKMCPLVQELDQREGIHSLCCVTAQHREMLDSVLDIFGRKPDFDLDIMQPRQTLSTITSKASGVNSRSTPSIEKSFFCWRMSEFLGSVRMLRKASLSRGCKYVSAGRRPISSGIKPKLFRS